MENPFKFGTLVEGEYFTDRVDEVRYICQFINSANHLVLISPRRFGKSSVLAKAIKESRRKSITVNLQQVTSLADFPPSCCVNSSKCILLNAYGISFLVFVIYPQ